MFPYILFFHSIFRWLVLASLFYSIYRAISGITKDRIFSKHDDSIRHWTATISHIQLMLGFVLYFISPTVKYFLNNTADAKHFIDVTFFAVIHISLMFISVLVITVGSAMAKRKEQDKQKFKTMLIFFSIALIVIFLAIPWPFSPLASRPFFRMP